jgi:hypothetical protein
MKVRPFYELTWKNSKDRENYERQGNFDTIASFEMWGTCNGKSMNIKKNTPIHIASVETRDTNPNFYLVIIEKEKDVIKTQLDEQQLLNLGFTKI